MNRKLFNELRRRKVFGVVGGYCVAALLVIQAADLAVQRFDVPGWTIPALLIALVIGFPVAVVVSWAFEVTSAGVVREAEVDRTVRATDPSARRADLILLLIVAIVTVFMGLERLVFSKRHEAGAEAVPVTAGPPAAMTSGTTATRPADL